MSQSITVRLTPTRARLLKMLKRRFNLKTNSEVIDLALRTSVQKEIEDEEIDYRARIEKVAGCLRKRSGKDAMKRIRELRDDE